ncbi:GIY-YIG nuclease family protein [Candidatus Gracilibacteria bacterium]|nr:GIY-YIG nuclease family protein [Candidatus Gracilibacteria bacterium]
MSLYSIYILKCSDQSYYTGWTTDVTRRVEEHNSSPKGAKYTHGRRPVELVYQEVFSTESEARKREYEIKQLKRIEKERLIQGISQCLKIGGTVTESKES